MITVAVLADSYLAYLLTCVQTGQLKPATRDWYDNQFAKLKQVAGHISVAKVAPADLVGVKFTYQFVRSVKTLFHWAVDVQLATSNPFRRVAVPKCRQRNRTIERNEMVRLYLASRRPLRRFLLMMRLTMARPGELRELRWSQVDLAGRMLRLREFKTKGRGTVREWQRPIPLSSRAVRILTTWRDRRQPSPNDPVFPDRSGKMRSGNSLRCLMRTARAKAGLVEDKNGERVVPYSIRHTGATEAIRNGVPQIVLADMLGHKQLETTNRYVHLNEDDMLKGIEQATRRRNPPKKPGT